jgi:acetate kinase
VKVLVLNAGSSSLKFSLYESDGERVLGEGLADWSATPARLSVRREGAAETRTELAAQHHGDATSGLLEALLHGHPPLLGGTDDLGAVGHRVVHGGDRYTTAVRITSEVKAAIAALAPLAPLHNPASLAVINVAEAALPNVPQVAAFDTAFHATLPPAARTYALPWSWTTDWGLRRYGFHGLSHAYCAGRAAELLGRPAAGLRLVICHLGNGCSAAAVRDGVSVDTSMGFTPMEGLMMGTRSGSVDPGLLLYVLRNQGVSADDLDRVLNHESGLLGVSGVSSDMRQVLAAAAGDERARLALDLFAHRVRQAVGALTATLGGLTALVFTAGIGEHAAAVRERVCAGLGHLGLELDARANAECRPDADVATAGSRGRILVIATREDLMIVRETVRVLGQPLRAGQGG